MTRAIQTAVIIFGDELKTGAARLLIRPELREVHPDVYENRGRPVAELRQCSRLRSLARWPEVEEALSDESVADWRAAWDAGWAMGESGAWQAHCSDPSRLVGFQAWLAEVLETRVAVVSHWGTINNLMNREPWADGLEREPVRESWGHDTWPRGGIAQKFEMPNCGWLAVVASPAVGAAWQIEAVITDVDGTLYPFGTNRQLSLANNTALQRAVDAGVHVCLATGRIPGPWSDAIRAELPGLGPGVFANGALVLGPDGEVLWEAMLPPEAITVVEAFTRGAQVGGRGRVAVIAATRWPEAGEAYGSIRYLELAPAGPTWVTELIKSAGEPEMVLVPDFASLGRHPVFKFVLFTLEEPGWVSMPETVSALRAALAETGAEVLDCGAKQCEILPPEVNKGSGVARLLAGLGGGVHAKAVMACGDAENDVEMLRLAGVGVAMGNAKAEALAAADAVVARSDDDGVAEAVRRFVFREGI